MTLQDYGNNLHELAKAVIENNPGAVIANIRKYTAQKAADAEDAVAIVSALIDQNDTPTYEKILAVPYRRGRNKEVDAIYDEARSIIEAQHGDQKIAPIVVAGLFMVASAALGANQAGGTPSVPPPPPPTFFEKYRIPILVVGAILTMALVVIIIKKARK